MSQIMKAFTGIFIVLFMMVSATGILGMFLQITKAQNTHAAILAEIENSDFARPILQDVFTIAENCGYGLEIVLYREDETAVYCTGADKVPWDVSDVFQVEVIMDYSINLSFFQVSASQECYGYAGG